MAGPQGPSANDLSAQAEATRDLAAAVQQLTAAFNQSSSAMTGQANASSQMGSAMSELESALSGANRSNEKFRTDIEKQIASMQSLGDAAKIASTVLKKLASENKKAAAGIAFASGALKGMASGFKLSFNLAKSFVSGVQSIIGAVFDLGAAILSLPFKLWESLIGMAKGGGGGGGGLLEALEKVREVFGDIQKGTAAEVIDIARGLASWGDMAPGLMRVSRQFGTLKDAIEYVMKLAGPAPVLFSSLKDQFEKTGKNVFIMAKGLGVGEEEFSGLMNAAKSFGQTVEGIEVEMTKFAKGLSAEFGLNSKLMSRDMARAMKDVKHFANSSVKEIAKATAYAHSLGLELKDITGILDAFNTFDQAAENVSKLSQAFGVNIDVMKLVEAKTPDEALSMLKDSLSAAGKSVETMNRQELQLLASTVGMSEEAVRQGMSSKNQAISMNRLAKTTQNLSAQTMTASEATQTLKNDIERVIGGGGGGGPESDSLLGMFLEGFTQGITTTESFRRIIANLRKDFVIVMQIGRELGRSFVEYFPGVKNFFEGLADMLSPAKIGGLFREFKNTFENFFKNIKKGASVKDLISSLVDDFTGYVKKSGPGGQKLLSGLSEMWEAAKLIIASGISAIGDFLRDGLNSIIRAFSDDPKDKIQSAFGKVAGEVSPKTNAFQEMFEKVKEPLKKLMKMFFSWLGDQILEFLKENWMIISAFVFGPALVKGFVGGVGGMIGQGLLKGLSWGLGKASSPILKRLGTSVGTQVAESAGKAAAPKLATAVGSEALKKKGLQELSKLESKQVLKSLATGKALPEIIGKGSKNKIQQEFSTLMAEGMAKGLTEKQARRAATTGIGKMIEGAVEKQATQKIAEKAGSSLALNMAKSVGAKLLTPKALNLGSLATSIGFGVASELKYASGDKKTGAALEAAGNVIGDALTGAAIGSAIPVIGTGIGAIVGAGVGAIRTGFSERFREGAFGPSAAPEKTMEEHIATAKRAGETSKQVADLHNEDESKRAEAMLKLLESNETSQKGFLDVMNQKMINQSEIFEQFRGQFSEQVSIIAGEAANMDKDTLANIISAREVTASKLAEGIEGKEGLDLLAMAKQGGLRAPVSDKELDALFGQDRAAQQAIMEKLGEKYDDEDELGIVMQGLAIRHLKRQNSRADEVRKAKQEQEDKEKQEAEKAAEEARKSAEREDFLKRLGLGEDSAKIDIQTAEKRFKEIDTLYSNLVGGRAEDLKTKISKMRDSLKGIDFSIMAPEDLKKAQEGFDQARNLVGMLKSLEMIGQFSKSASAALTGAKLPDASSLKTQLSPFLSSVQTLITENKDKLKDDLHGIAKQVEDLGTDSAQLAKGIETYKNNAISLNRDLPVLSAQLNTLTTTKITSTAASIKANVQSMVDALNQFQSGLSAMSESGNSISLKLGTVANGLGIKDATYPIKSGGVSIALKIDVHMDAKQLEAQLVSKDSSIIVGAFNKAGNIATADKGWQTQAGLQTFTPKDTVS